MRTAIRQMMGVFAQLERATIVRRMKDGRETKAQNGGYAFRGTRLRKPGLEHRHLVEIGSALKGECGMSNVSGYDHFCNCGYMGSDRLPPVDPGESRHLDRLHSRVITGFRSFTAVSVLDALKAWGELGDESYLDETGRTKGASLTELTEFVEKHEWDDQESLVSLIQTMAGWQSETESWTLEHYEQITTLPKDRPPPSTGLRCIK